MQSFEFLALANTIHSSSPWSWDIVRMDFVNWPKIALKFLDSIYKTRFRFLIYLHLLFILLLNLKYNWLIPLTLIITNLLICFRFRGSFNGGSDYMTMTVLMGLTFSSVDNTNSNTIKLGLYCIAFQCTFSYFIAGFVKLKNQGWRSGLALKSFLLHSNYLVPRQMKILSKSELIIKISTWAIILWEITFPIIWLIPKITIPALIVAFGFHLGNYFTFGLNRFVFAWLACYPAIIFCTQ